VLKRLSSENESSQGGRSTKRFCEGWLHEGKTAMLKVLSGKVVAGADVRIGENVTVDVAEELIIGDRTVISDNARFEGRRIELGADCFCYSWDWRQLDIGRGRKDEEDAVLTVGSRCTFHDNRIDLSRFVTIGDDVGLSPEVCLYCHYYWLSPLDGFPCRQEGIEIRTGSIVGFRSTILPGTRIGPCSVIGANSVVTGALAGYTIYAGNPAKLVREIAPLSVPERAAKLFSLMVEYDRTLAYRGASGSWEVDYPKVRFAGVEIDCEQLTCEGEEGERSDDLRWHLFRNGIRIFTKRPFAKLPRAAR